MNYKIPSIFYFTFIKLNSLSSVSYICAFFRYTTTYGTLFGKFPSSYILFSSNLVGYVNTKYLNKCISFLTLLIYFNRPIILFSNYTRIEFYLIVETNPLNTFSTYYSIFCLIFVDFIVNSYQR